MEGPESSITPEMQDWEIIRKVKEAVKIPVIGNGDVTSGQKALDMFEQTGCDGVMIGRGCREIHGSSGNYWHMKRPDPFRKDRAQTRSGKQCCVMQDCRSSSREIISESVKCASMWHGISKGMQGSAKLRDEINQVESYEELENLLMEKIG